MAVFVIRPIFLAENWVVSSDKLKAITGKYEAYFDSNFIDICSHCKDTTYESM